jgi:hypothetical protein
LSCAKHGRPTNSARKLAAFEGAAEDPFMRTPWVVTAFAIVSIACGACLGDQRAAESEAVIHILCNCNETLPKAQELCVEMLEKQGTTLPDRCVKCILANSNSCTTLMTVCDNDCQRPQPTGRETP